MPLTPAWTQLRYHEKQTKLWRTKARFVAVAAGRGSGKTELARRRVVRMLAVRREWPDPIFFYALPTLNQARRVAWNKLKALVPHDWLADDPKEGEMTITTKFGSKLYLVGMDKPQRVEGVQWDGGVIDEACDQKPGAFRLSVRPALSHRNGWCWMIGVPKRWGPGAADFKRIWEEWGSKGAGFESYTWPSADILPPEEMHEAARGMDQKDFDEQYGAIWQDTSGLVFYAFDEEDNVTKEIVYDPQRPIVVGSDFNVNPMCWVLMQQSPHDKRVYCVFDEIFLRNTNTPATLEHLFKRYGTHEGGWLFFGDATARARNTRATASDYAHIMNDKRFNRARVFYPRANPPIVERFASTNMMLCNAAGERRLLIHPKCVNLIYDLQSRAYEPGKRTPDDHDDIGHITDALGYPLWRLFPVIAEVQGTSQLYSTSLG